MTAAESLDPETGGQHRRWMVHGTSHHLGLDVHDCAQARQENYRDAELRPGMVITVEPGLYFKATDLLVPEELRGIGVRIEDDIVITDDGCEILSDQPAPRPGRRRGLDGRHLGPLSARSRPTASDRELSRLLRSARLALGVRGRHGSCRRPARASARPRPGLVRRSAGKQVADWVVPAQEGVARR